MTSSLIFDIFQYGIFKWSVCLVSTLVDQIVIISRRSTSSRHLFSFLAIPHEQREIERERERERERLEYARESGISE